MHIHIHIHMYHVTYIYIYTHIYICVYLYIICAGPRTREWQDLPQPSFVCCCVVAISYI